MMCPRCNGDIRPWGVCQCGEKILKARIAELEAELKECRRTALGDGYERANIEHAGHFAELEAENARLRDTIAYARTRFEAYDIVDIRLMDDALGRE